MLRYSANLSMLFTELPWLDRPAAARDAGFAGIEIQFPYQLPVTDLKRAIDDCGLPLVLFNFPAGDFMEGGCGNAALPAAVDEFEAALELGLEYARQLKPHCMNLLSGREAAGYTRQQCLDCFANNLRLAARALDGSGIQLVTEAINHIDQPGFLLADAQSVIDLLDDLVDCNVKLQYDIYHMQMMAVDQLQCLSTLMPRIGHIQFADVPGRHQPGSGDIEWSALFDLIDASDYQGFVGAEYLPLPDTAASLHWLPRSGL